jgi:hypothetical protein
MEGGESGLAGQPIQLGPHSAVPRSFPLACCPPPWPATSFPASGWRCIACPPHCHGCMCPPGVRAALAERQEWGGLQTRGPVSTETSKAQAVRRNQGGGAGREGSLRWELERLLLLQDSQPPGLARQARGACLKAAPADDCAAADCPQRHECTLGASCTPSRGSRLQLRGGHPLVEEEVGARVQHLLLGGRRHAVVVKAQPPGEGWGEGGREV